MTFVTSGVKQPLSGDKPLILTQGDPAGVGPAISLLAWEALHRDPEYAFYIRGGSHHLRREASRLNLDVDLVEISTPSEAIDVFRDALPVLDLPGTDVEAGIPDVKAATGIVASIENGVRDVQSGEADAIVTNPISKSLLYATGFPHPGHTEFLAELARSDKDSEAPLPVMMLVGGGLRVALATIHIPLMNVAGVLTPEHLVNIGVRVHSALKWDFGLVSPRLGICGLNPHAGEDGTIGREDVDIIQPAIEALRSMDVNAIGPRPGDTVFHEALSGRYDAVIAMYHDQGLIPVKTLDIWGGVNATLGLPFVRTSPDHGTGYDAAKTGDVRADSLIAAIRLARDMATNRKAFEMQHG